MRRRPSPGALARHPLPQGERGDRVRRAPARSRAPETQTLGRSKTSAASATTTSRSMAGAAPRSTTSCASSTIFPARRSSAWSATTAAPAHILAAASHLIAHNEGRLGKTLRTEDVPGEKVQVTSTWDSEEEARAIGEEIEQLQRGNYNDESGSAPRTRSTRSPSWCAPRSRCASSRTASSRSACPIG